MSRKYEWGEKQDRNRHVCKMRLRGLTYKQIAEQMEISITTTKEIIYRWHHAGRPKP